MRELIAQGAEAKLYKEDDRIIKHRFEKKYRLSFIDKKLRGFRTRREAKVLGKLEDIVPCPKVLKNDEKETLEIEFIDGPKVRDVLEKMDCKKICKELGKKIALMHDNGIIHGDLTTSNMIWKDEVYFIDFGLSFFSDKYEDKAVDLHLLKQALESKHYTIFEECYQAALDSYRKNSEHSKQVLKRLEKVETRGRYKRRKR
jgi:TP53 regulating kinase-like protein